MEYQIITGDYPYDVEDDVRMFIGKGWKPLGGVSVTLCKAEDYMLGGDSTFFWYAQAMIREKTTDGT